MYPRWLSLLVLGVLGYMLLMGVTSHKAAPVVAPVAVKATSAAPAAAENTTANPAYAKLAETADIEHWKRALNPEYAAIMAKCEAPKPVDGKVMVYHVIPEQEGEGAAAQCGDAIHVQFAVWDTHGHVLYEGASETVLGSQDVAAGMDSALVGLRPGGIRTVILPPELLGHMKNSAASKPLLRALNPANTAIVTVTRLP